MWAAAVAGRGEGVGFGAAWDRWRVVGHAVPVVTRVERGQCVSRSLFLFGIRLYVAFLWGKWQHENVLGWRGGAAPGAWGALLGARWGCPRWQFFGPSGVEVGVSQSLPFYTTLRAVCNAKVVSCASQCAHPRPRPFPLPSHSAHVVLHSLIPRLGALPPGFGAPASPPIRHRCWLVSLDGRPGETAAFTSTSPPRCRGRRHQAHRP